jgi:hypothetical protein
MKKILFTSIIACNILFGSNYDLNKNSNKTLVIDKTNGTHLSENKPIWQNNLAWQDEEYTDNEKEAYLNNDKNYDKVGDLEYAKEYCKKSTYFKFDNWRLPNYHELNLLRNNYNELNPKFKKSPKGFFWSIDEDLHDKSKYKRVSFDINRADSFVNKNYKLYIRCVRGEYKTDSNLTN